MQRATHTNQLMPFIGIFLSFRWNILEDLFQLMLDEHLININTNGLQLSSRFCCVVVLAISLSNEADRTEREKRTRINDGEDKAN